MRQKNLFLHKNLNLKCSKVGTNRVKQTTLALRWSHNSPQGQTVVENRKKQSSKFIMSGTEIYWAPNAQCLLLALCLLGSFVSLLVNGCCFELCFLCCFPALPFSLTRLLTHRLLTGNASVCISLELWTRCWRQRRWVRYCKNSENYNKYFLVFPGWPLHQGKS